MWGDGHGGHSGTTINVPDPWVEDETSGGRERMWVNLSTEGSSARLLGGVRPGPLIAWCPGPWSRLPESEESAQGQ